MPTDIVKAAELCPILPYEMVSMIISFLDHKTICKLQASSSWKNYYTELKKIRGSNLRLNCYKLGIVCKKCNQLCDGVVEASIIPIYDICENCWYNCKCGIRSKLSNYIRCMECSIKFCNKCIKSCIDWSNANLYDKLEHITCRECTTKYCYKCNNTYDYNTAKKCNKCFSIYCNECDTSYCYKCQINYDIYIETYELQ